MNDVISRKLKKVDDQIKSASNDLVDHLCNLPLLIQECIDTLEDTNDKEVFFIGAIGVISGILPNVYGIYDGKNVYPNLYCYIVAKYGAGKGSLTYCRYLAQAIHRKKKDEFKFTLDEFDDLRKKHQEGVLKEKPNKPTQKLVFIPANNSKSGMLDLLENNDGKGIIFETEGDTMADNVKQDYGNYSNVFRMAFHHESISYNRRTDKVYCDIENPCLSVVLSSTFGQLKNLIPNIENGLFSRFLFYQFDASEKFKNVFSKEKNYYPEKFQSMSIKFQNLYERLSSVESVKFSLSVPQEKKFMDYFSQMKSTTGMVSSRDLDGTIHRLGLICFRMCMIFSTLRIFENENLKEIPSTIMCKDVDFQKSLKLVEILKYNAYSIYRALPKSNVKHESFSNDEIKIYECITMLKKENKDLSLNDISKLLRTTFHLDVNRNKVDRIIKKYKNK